MSISKHCKEFLSQCKTEFSTCIDMIGNDVSIDMGRVRLKFLKRNIERADGTALIEPSCAKDLVGTISEALRHSETASISVHCEPGYSTPRMSHGRVGPPTCEIAKEQLLFFADCGFTAGKMAEMLDVSESTIKRRLSSFDIKLRCFAQISDADLQKEITDLTHQNHLMGPNAVRARLTGKGIKVQRWRVRDTMLQMDPAGAAMRGLLKKPHRRTYKVSGPNSLWHVDGNHKLIRWNMVIHGAIDGFSRMVVFMRVSASNTAATVLSHFTDAVLHFGLPSRVRCDHGGENNDMCLLMEVLQGEGRGSVIRGASVHNQRIERAWVDVWKDVTNVYYELFYYLEDQNFLNPDNMVDLWSLHFIYIPRIAKDLFNFQRQWNNHGIRTENNQTPIQLFVSKSLSLFNTSHTAMTDLFATSSTSGLSSSASSSDTDQPSQHNSLHWNSEVVVPSIPCPLNNDQKEELQRLVNPLDNSVDTYGICMYLKTRTFVSSHVM